MNSFVFDTYALIEIIQGNDGYASYIDSSVIMNSFILAELCYALIRKLGPQKANSYVDKYAPFCIGVTPNTIKEAMLFRAMNIRRSLSMVDCIGYAMAKNLNVKFLTGDLQFKDMENVVFVK